MGRRLQQLQRATRERIDCLHRHLSLEQYLVCSLVEYDHIIMIITMGIFKYYQKYFHHIEGSNNIRKLFCMKLVNKL